MGVKNVLKRERTLCPPTLYPLLVGIKLVFYDANGENWLTHSILARLFCKSGSCIGFLLLAQFGLVGNYWSSPDILLVLRARMVGRQLARTLVLMKS